MKKLYILIVAFFAMTFIKAADFTGIKIYINPGHGGWDGNDRNVKTLNYAMGDTLGFWESSSNLAKGLELRDLLEAKGASVFMSRTKNRTEDDRSLSEIAEEANANNVDAFLSIHSNALGAVNPGTNYLLQLYHGNDNQPTVAASLPMCQAAWTRLVDNKLTIWTNYPTASTTNYRGDFSFYGNTQGLGVLRPLTVPGFLNEGSFHDYVPETQRLLNNDYRKLESYRFLQYFCDYFKVGLPATGVIGGWIKGKDEHVNNPLYTYKAFTEDEWLPLNGARIKLMNAAGDSINGYTVDTLYNGVFAFKDLVPGNYKLRITAKNHNTKDTTIAVTAGTISYMKVMMFNPNLPIYKEIPPDYPDPKQETGAIALKNYNFKKITETNPDWLNGTSIRKVLFRNEKLYVLTEEPKILIVDAATFQKTAEMNLTGITGGVKPLSDINFTSDGALLGCNKDTVSLPEIKDRWFKVYYWENDTSSPQLLFKSQSQGNWGNGIMGETFAVTGAKWKCLIYTTSVTSGATKAVRIVGYSHNDSISGLGYKYMLDATNYTEALWGQKIKFTISPNATDNIMIDGEKMLPAEYKFDWTAADRSPLVLQGAFEEASGYQLQATASGNFFFKNAKHIFMAAPNAQPDASYAGVTLFDVTEGLKKAVKTAKFLPESGLGATPAPYMAAFAKVNGYDIDLIVLAEKQGINRFTTIKSTKANVYASELKTEDAGTAYKLSFTLNDSILGGKIEILKEETLVYTLALDTLARGVQSVTINKNILPAGDYKWKISVMNVPVDRPVKVSDNTWKQLQFYSPRGVAVDNTMESPYFGRVYASETAGGTVATNTRTTKDGIYILNSALQDITNQADNSYAGGVTWSTTLYSPMRLAVAPDGKVYLTDFSNNHPGVWIMDPANPSANFKPVFTNDTTQNAVGLVKNKSGQPLFGSISHCWITGAGVDTKLFTFDQDYVDAEATSGGNLLQYNIGLLEAPWAVPPSAVVYNDGKNGNLQQNFNSSIAPDGKGGWWISQFRDADAANTPSLIHVNTAGTVDFNSGKTPALIGNSYQGGMAVNYDGNVLAMGCKDEVKVYALTYNADNIPSLVQIYSIKPAMGTNSAGLSFDRAGNLYVISNSSERLGVWALPKADNTFTTLAAHTLSFVDTGVKEEKNNMIVVYPNPVRDRMIVKSQNNVIKSVTLFDINGKMLLQKEVNSNQQDLQLGSFAEGVYVLKVTALNGETTTKRIIKR